MAYIRAIHHLVGCTFSCIVAASPGKPETSRPPGALRDRDGVVGGEGPCRKLWQGVAYGSHPVRHNIQRIYIYNIWCIISTCYICIYMYMLHYDVLISHAHVLFIYIYMCTHSTCKIYKLRVFACLYVCIYVCRCRKVALMLYSLEFLFVWQNCLGTRKG